jgi:amino acid adenylation domain-containing protein
MEKFSSDVTLFDEQALCHPDEPAVIFSGGKLSYRELRGRAERLARRLILLGVRPGDRVPLFLERGPEALAGMLGILRCGGVYVPIDAASPSDRVGYILEEVGARVMVSGGLCMAAIPPGCGCMVVEGEGDAGKAGDPDPIVLPELSADDPAYILYTSGSTGRPKGVVVSHGNLAHFLGNIKRRYGRNGPVSMPFLASPAFDISLFQLFLPWLTGGSSIVVEKEEVMDAGKLADILDQVNMVDTVPAVYANLAGYRETNTPIGRFDRIQRLFIGGDLIPDGLLERLALIFRKAVITVTYGPTEGTVFCTDISYSAANMPARCRGVVIGRPMAGTCVYLMDKYLNPSPLGSVGEICLGGRGVSSGYWWQETQTSQKFVKHALADGKVIYRTGDLGRWRQDGTLEFAGRMDDQVKIRGFRIEPGEVEGVLKQAPGVGECIVVAHRDGQGNNRLVGYSVARPGYDKAQVLRYLRAWLPEHMVPSVLVELARMPLTANGKVNRRALPDPEYVSGEHVDSRNEIERRLVAIWMDLLAVERVGVRDNFFERGGHSLMAMRLSAAIEKAFDAKVSIKSIFELMTIEQMAQYIQIEQNSKIQEDYEKIEL